MVYSRRHRTCGAKEQHVRSVRAAYPHGNPEVDVTNFLSRVICVQYMGMGQTSI